MLKVILFLSVKINGLRGGSKKHSKSYKTVLKEKKKLNPNIILIYLSLNINSNKSYHENLRRTGKHNVITRQ